MLLLQFDDTPEEREAHFEKLWKQAGFGLWLGGYKDYLSDVKANREAYVSYCSSSLTSW